MARITEARRTAYEILGEVRRRDAYARDLLRTSKRMRALDARERAFATRLVLGVTATRGMLDASIARHLSRKHLQPQVKDALRLATYELLFCQTPASAAVSQGVELVRRKTPRAAGLANAVLHRIVDKDVRRRAEAVERVGQGQAAVSDLALVSGYPTWLLERVADERGSACASAMALSALEPAPVYVAGNAARLSSDKTRSLLEEAGLEPKQTDVGGAFVLGQPTGLAASGLVEEAQVVVADLSAQRIAGLITPSHDARLLEVGQGRGTKSILMQNMARMRDARVGQVGIDALAYKVKVATERMRKANVSDCVSCMAFDACDLNGNDLPEPLAGPFDVVFVDAPCSGSGTLRRHPEIVWSLTPQKVEDLSKLQMRMLNAAASRVAEGGALFYATCSVFERENERIVEEFLSGEMGSHFMRERESFQTTPTADGPDGHFCACLRRSAR